ncbi:MAG: single-stranded DNA-binding protein [Actinomycetota bacterium]|nr:single-stranded DNA-binding protein [Actinomycetota bacterium]
MSEVQVTLHGYVGQDVLLKQMGRFDMATFRVGTTPRWRDPQGQYRHSETVWTSVTCWRGLAQNVKESVHVGDPVVVIGKVRTERWTTPDGQPRERQVVEATTVAHDLARGTSVFRKTTRPEPGHDERTAVGAVLDEAEQSPVGIDPATGEPLYPVGTAQRAGERAAERAGEREPGRTGEQEAGRDGEAA